jgi:hypothetical protein
MKTRIKNVAPAARFYGFLPPHGLLLAKDQEVTLDGDLRTVLAGGRNRYKRPNELAGLQRALDGVDLEYETIADAQSSSSMSSSSST